MNTVWLMTTVAMERVLDSYYERVRGASSREGIQPDSDFLKEICSIYELKHSAYITIDKRSLTSRKPKFLVTYPVEWQEEYRRSFAEKKDPVIQSGSGICRQVWLQMNAVRDCLLRETDLTRL